MGEMVSEQEIIGRIGHEHPKLTTQNFKCTSPDDGAYNCIAWAGDDQTNYWWPDPFAFWPVACLDETIANFVAAFKTRGYKVGKGVGSSKVVERIAIFALNGLPKHAARQLSDGTWTSKLGPLWDISHQLGALTGGAYGEVHSYMHRKRPIIQRQTAQRAPSATTLTRSSKS